MDSIEGYHREHREIMTLLENNSTGSMYFSEIVAGVSFSKPTVVSKLNDLQRDGILTTEEVGQKKYYSLTETGDKLRSYRNDMEKIADGWVNACKYQVRLYEKGDIQAEEFMQRIFGTLVPLLPMQLWGTAYMSALEFDRQGFFDEPDGDLDRKQGELLRHAYEVCRKYELEGMKVLDKIDYDEIEGESSDYLHTPSDATLAAEEIQLFDASESDRA